MEVEESKRYVLRKNYLLRENEKLEGLINNGTETKEEVQAIKASLSKNKEELGRIERIMRKIITNKLQENKEQMIEDAKNIKKNSTFDGDVKRSVARMLIAFMRNMLTDQEIKGVFRQGYKIMRGK